MSTSSRTWARPVGGAFVVAAILAASALVGGGPVAGDEDSKSSLESSAVATVPALTQRTIARMAAGGTRTSDAAVQQFGKGPALGEAQAAELAGRGFAGLLQGRGPVEAGLTRVTIENYGIELESDPMKPSRIQPIVEDRLAWIIVFDNVEVPVMTPIAKGGEEPVVESTYTSDLFVVVDALTGKVLMAETI